MDDQALKRKRSETHDGSPYLHHHASKASRPTPPHAEPTYVPPTVSYAQPHVQINYLARQFPTDTPFLSPNDDSLRTCLHIINQYDAALERSESLANNLGARPLSSVLLQRFERMFDGPPKVVSYAHLNAVVGQGSISWLDVVEACNSVPSDRVLEMDDPQDNNRRVVRLEVKGCEIQVSWEEWQMVRSGMLQKMMPAQPVEEDEDKELGTLDILEDIVGKAVGLADQVAARGRQFNHRLRARRSAITERRAANATSEHITNGTPTHQYEPANPSVSGSKHATKSMEVHAELLRLFNANRRSTRSPPPLSHTRRPSSNSRPLAPSSPDATSTFDSPSQHPTQPLQHQTSSSSNQATPNKHANPQRPRRPPQPPQDEGPFKAEMAARMDILPKGSRIYPPCDRCRRLRMDCLKNLTACLGCTKKHCKCAWREVTQEEVAKGCLLAHPAGLMHGFEQEGVGNWRDGLDGVKVPGDEENRDGREEEMLASLNAQGGAQEPKDDIKTSAGEQQQQQQHRSSNSWTAVNHASGEAVRRQGDEAALAAAAIGRESTMGGGNGEAGAGAADGV